MLLRSQQVLVFFYISLVHLTHSASLRMEHRTKRGLLSRSGICPKPIENFYVKDARLNFYGTSYTLPGDEKPDCNRNECTGDDECSGDQKCCTNHCGASICTEAVRDPHPCELFPCPATKICKIERVRCIDPVCPDLYAISRPICVPGGPLYEIGKRSRIPRPNILAYLRQRAFEQSRRSEEVRFQPPQSYYTPEKKPYI